MAIDSTGRPPRPPLAYRPFAVFVVQAALLTMVLLTVLMLALPVLSGDAGLTEVATALSAIPQVLIFFAMLLFPVLIVGLTIGYGVWRLVLAAGLGVISAALAVAATGSATLGYLVALFLAPAVAHGTDNAFERLFLSDTLLAFAVSGPASAFVVWRRYVRGG